MEDRLTGSALEYLKDLGLRLLSAWAGVYTLFAAAITFVLNQLPDRFSFLGGVWSNLLFFLALAIVFAGYRIYSATVHHYEVCLQAIHAKRPELEVGFVTTTGNIVSNWNADISPVPPNPSKEQYANEHRVRLADRYKKAAHQVAEHRRTSPLSALSGYGSMALIDESHYHRQIELFIPKWGQYLQERRAYELGRHCTIAVYPVISNVGPVIANSVSLVIDIPPELRPAFDTEIEALEDSKGDYLPSRPEDPKAIEYRGYFSDLMPTYDYPNSYEPELPNPSDPRGPIYVSRGDAYHVRYDLPSITPRRGEDNLPPFHLVVDNVRDTRTFIFTTRLFADSLNLPIEDELTLHISIVSDRSEVR